MQKCSKGYLANLTKIEFHTKLIFKIKPSFSFQFSFNKSLIHMSHCKHFLWVTRKFKMSCAKIWVNKSSQLLWLFLLKFSLLQFKTNSHLIWFNWVTTLINYFEYCSTFDKNRIMSSLGHLIKLFKYDFFSYFYRSHFFNLFIDVHVKESLMYEECNINN